MKTKTSYYSHQEEKLNVISHAIGLLLSVVGLFFLVYKALKLNQNNYVASVVVYGISLIILYSASTFYHATKNRILRTKLNILDHAAIYVLIAGTYTPFTLITLPKNTGLILFFVVWTIAFFGVILKIFFTGKFKLLSTILYVLMGWLVIFVINPLIDNLATQGLYLLFAGGVFYTLGAVLFMIEKLKFNHAIFHLFVLLGSLSHFFAIYQYIIV
ncbi:hemolysin III [Mesonia phycicola]|uniref:Hemolysin III n=1 Tax=Mesonia phycicola TaxID=579105 RepID=A0A1M6G0N5_9FLAO|nr:hemolysin III family protein [Mesonia phycicola]SHJ03469.1 hemolysin III [Mesonia phycicola]